MIDHWRAAGIGRTPRLVAGGQDPQYVAPDSVRFAGQAVVREPNDENAHGRESRVAPKIPFALLHAAGPGRAVQREVRAIVLGEDVEVGGVTAEPDRVLPAEYRQAGTGEHAVVAP